MTVNPQITDSVTQANANIQVETPAQDIAILHQTFAHSVAIAIQNAVVTLQQANVIAQAATAQGVATILSIDTAATANAVKDLADATARIETAMPAAQVEVPQLTPGGSSDLASEARALATALAFSLDALGRATMQNLTRIVQLAATTTCLSAMVALPDKAAAYEQILVNIQNLKA